MTTPEPQTIAGTPRMTSTTGLDHLFDKPKRARGPRERPATAVLYLRVSTARQTHTGADVDEDGNSIATQREHTLKRVRELRATVAKEFVEPGASARSIAKRPVFKEMLRYVEEHPEVTHIVAYQRSRMFRNLAEGAIVETTLSKRGVQLVSAKENFSDGADGFVMKTMTDLLNQWQSQKSGEDIAIKMAHKVEQGGVVGRAKLGYLNVRKNYEGRLVNTIDVDPDRAPLLRWAFEQYATGQFSIAQLTVALDGQGLNTRPSAKRPASPLSKSQVAVILRDPFYTGVVHYKGKLYAGRHEPLITKDLYLSVQAVLDHRNRKGDRDRTHLHYLRGLLVCGECQRAGRHSRLVYSLSQGNGGAYEYYLCTAKQRGECNAPAVRVDRLEVAIERAVASEAIYVDDLEEIRVQVQTAIQDLQVTERELRSNLLRERQKLEAQEERLIELAADGTLSTPKLRERLSRITTQRGAIEERLAQTDERLRFGAQKLLEYLNLLEDPGRLYVNAPDEVRRELLLAFFTHLIVETIEGGVEVDGARKEVNQTLRDVISTANAGVKTNSASRIFAEGAATSRSMSHHVAQGLNKNELVGVTGFEIESRKEARPFRSGLLPEITAFSVGI